MNVTLNFKYSDVSEKIPLKCHHRKYLKTYQHGFYTEQCMFYREQHILIQSNICLYFIPI